MYMNFNIIEKSEIHCRMVPIIFFYALSLKYTFFYKGLAKSFSFLSKLKKEDFFGPLRIYVLYPVFYIFDDDETSFFLWFWFLTEEIQYHDGLRSRELGQAPILLCS